MTQLAFPAPPGTYASRIIARQRFKLLDISVKHLDALMLLPLHHRDPFDRMLIAQAAVDALTIVTADRSFEAYPVSSILI